MRILFVGVIHPGWVNTTLMRMKVLIEQGHEVRPLCLAPFLRWGGRYGGALFRRLLWGPPLRLANRAVVEETRRFRPELIWVDKGVWVTAATLAETKDLCDPFRVHYTPDPALLFHRSRHFLRAIPGYDLLITTKRYELELYSHHGARRVLQTNPAYDETTHRPVELSAEERRRFACDAAFIGTYAKGRERYLGPLSQLPVDLAIWGNNWSESCTDQRLLARYRGSALSGQSYARGLAGAKIGLGLLSPLVPDRATTRSVEIPACGTFLLAERTEEHADLFEEGREAEFFSSAEELVAKVRTYLTHHDERESIAAAGRARCLESGYSYQRQLATIIDQIPDGSARSRRGTE